MGYFFRQIISSEVHSDSSRSVLYMLHPHNTFKKIRLGGCLFGC